MQVVYMLHAGQGTSLLIGMVLCLVKEEKMNVASITAIYVLAFPMVSTCVCVCVCVYIQMYICLYIYIYIYVYVYMYTHTYQN
jgi:hypothetical protein